VIRRALIVAMVLAGPAGCATVKPHQRETLAKPCMDPTLGDPDAVVEHRARVTETKTGGGSPGEPPGGGCGCSQ
jgi:hypothetical protein